MRTNEPKYDLFNEEERAFLERMFVAYPHIAEQFDHYLDLEPFDRIAQAMKDLREIKRSGWVKWGVEAPESISEHMDSMASLVRLAKAPEGTDMDAAVQMALFHDVPEAIATDFTPYDGITKDDKHRLEMLAARVVFAFDPEALALYEEYEAQETITSHWVNDCDKLDAVYTSIRYEAAQPSFDGALFNEFITTSKPRMKTEEGRKLWNEASTKFPQMLAAERMELEQLQSSVSR